MTAGRRLREPPTTAEKGKDLPKSHIVHGRMGIKPSIPFHLEACPPISSGSQM